MEALVMIGLIGSGLISNNNEDNANVMSEHQVEEGVLSIVKAYQTIEDAGDCNGCWPPI